MEDQPPNPAVLAERLTRTETELQGVGESVRELEERFERGMKELKGDIADLSKVVSKQYADTLSARTVSWPLVASVAGLILVGIGWASKQAVDTAVNKTEVTLHREYQDRDNSATKEWNRRIVDRSMADKANIQANSERLTAIESNLGYVQMMQNRRYQSIMDNTKRTGEHEARIAQNEEELDKRWPQILESTNKLGKLDPLISEMGISRLEGVRQRMEAIERRVEAIDNDGSRGTNLRLGGNE